MPRPGSTTTTFATRADNPTLDLMDGIVRWHVYVTPPSAAREITFILEYDPAGLDNLFVTTGV